MLLPDVDAENRGADRDPARKQHSYVPLVNPYDRAQPGWVDLDATVKVSASYSFGAIRKSVLAGWITAQLFDDATLTTPVVAGVSVTGVASLEVRISGSGFVSVAPDITAVLFSVFDAYPPAELQLSQGEVLAAPYSGSIAAGLIAFTAPFTSPLGQVLRAPAEVHVRVYSDGVLSAGFRYDHPGVGE